MQASSGIADDAAAAGVAYLRAPFSGNPAAIRSGAATLVVSGPAAAEAALRPLLEAIVPTVRYAGAGEQARVLKLVLQVMIGGTAGLLAEALTLGEAAGVERSALLETIGSSVAGSRFVDYKTEPLLADDYSATFTTAMAVKDIDLVLALAETTGADLRLTRELRALLESACDHGHADEDFLSIVPELKARSTARNGDEGRVTEMSDTANIASRGASMAVDWEQRVDFRGCGAPVGAGEGCAVGSELGCLLLFDPNNLRYVTSTAIGTWERDKNIRFALVFRDEDPILWDFGSAARHHQLYCPWLPESSWRAWVPPMRGAMPDPTGVPDALAEMSGVSCASVVSTVSRWGWMSPT